MYIFLFVLEFLVLYMEMYTVAITRIHLNVVKIWRRMVRTNLYIVRTIAELTWLVIGNGSLVLVRLVILIGCLPSGTRLVNLTRNGNGKFGINIRSRGPGLFEISKIVGLVDEENKHPNICVGDKILALNHKLIKKTDVLKDIIDDIKISGSFITLELSKRQPAFGTSLSMMDFLNCISH